MKKLLMIIVAIAFLTSCGTAFQNTTNITEYQDTKAKSETSNVIQKEAIESTITPQIDTTETSSISETAEQENILLVKTNTSDGIELNPDSEVPSEDGMLDPNDHIGQSFLLKRFDDYTAIYGVFSNETVTDEYGNVSPIERVIIQHNGKTDDCECKWTGGRWSFPVSNIELVDIDHDGENEIVMINNVSGGMMCYIDELTVFDKKDGVYNKHVGWDDYEDNLNALNESFGYDIDTSAKRVTFTTDAGTFWQDYNNIPEDSYEGMAVDSISAIDVISFEIEDDKITGFFTTGGIVKDKSRMPFFFTDFEFDVKFDGETISFENFRLTGYDYLLEQERTDELEVDFKVIAHDRTTDDYIEVMSDSAFLPQNKDNADRYSDLDVFETEIMGQKTVEVRHAVMYLMKFSYYSIIDGKPVKLAENFGNNIYENSLDDVWNRPRTLSYDLDNDGCSEFITEDMHGDGIRTINVYRFENGKSYVVNLSEFYGEPGNGLQGYPDIYIEKQKDGQYIEDYSDYTIKIGSFIDKNGETEPEKEIHLGDVKINEMEFTEYNNGDVNWY